MDASPQFNVIQRVGGTLGTAMIAVVLQSSMPASADDLAGTAVAFGMSYRWVMAVTVVALCSSAHLWWVERVAARSAEPTAVPDTALA